jgi:hypothetical protein
MASENILYNLVTLFHDLSTCATAPLLSQTLCFSSLPLFAFRFLFLFLLFRILILYRYECH